ncbi:MAG: mechanosensitive ion channel [Planctomycetes bacterium]|nr:mechanosensitive ion channel [Planctomycetota bacterium]
MKPTDQQRAPKKERVSEADQIIRLQKYLDIDSKTLEKTRNELSNPKSEYRLAEEAFKKLDLILDHKRTELKKVKSTGAKAAAAKLEGEISALEQQRSLARDRFEVALKERKILQERAALLTVKTEKIRRAIALLQGAPPPGTKEAPATPDRRSPPQAAPSVENPAPKAPPLQPTPPGAPVSMELLKAQKEAASKDAAAKNAKDKLKAIDDRIIFLNKNVDLDKRILEILHEKAESAAAIRANLQKELAKKRAAKIAEDELTGLVAKLAEAEKLVAATATDIRETGDRLANLQTGLKKLAADKLVAQEQVDRTGKEAVHAEDRVKFLQSPLAPHNLIAWSWAHVPAIGIVLIAMLLLHWMVRLASQRIVQWVSRYQFRGNQRDRENRADTLVGVFRNTASFLIIVGGTLMILQALGIPILPLLGGAAAGGLAVAFGAQSLIKDYLSGFMLLLEDQYGINDVVKIAGITGQVENITLRMTVLRDNEGTVHFVPHNTIVTVSNMTHRWARAFLEIRVAYHEDVDHVMLVLEEICRELRADPAFGPFILDDPEMLGVDQLTENGITIQFLLRTSPLKQWPVKRELLRRIKARFGELGIELPHKEFTYTQPSPNGIAPADGRADAPAH